MMRLENVLSVESIRRNPASDGQAAKWFSCELKD